MIKKQLFIAISSVLVVASSHTQAQVNFVPKPVKTQQSEGQFSINQDTSIITESDKATHAVAYLKQRINAAAQFNLKDTKVEKNAIIFREGKAPTEGYTLNISSTGVVITASDSGGFFYGAISLLQLMPAEIWSENPQGNLKSIRVSNGNITDYPRFVWRGMMLDVSRNFHSKEYVMKFIDRMAQHKLNTFHWHLTDDEGWRIEIKKYPKLTSTGATRGPGTKLPFNIIPAIEGEKDKVQSGFYTQEDIREVVAYATARNVTIVPEIDVPGHAKAAIVAYPELLQHPDDKSSYKSVQGTPNNTIDPGLETTYVFLDNVLKEVAELFPGKYIHVGGDERPHGAWEKSPSVAALMKKQGLKNGNEVQGYFFQRLEAILKKYDRTMIGWEEIVHGDRLTRDDSSIMSWHKPEIGLSEAQKGRNVVLVPAAYLYYDLKYERHPSEPGLVWAGVTDTRDSYSYKPTPDNLTDKQRKHILGVHGCLWSETLTNRARTDYMSWPRMFALSEIGWTPQEDRNWEDFSERVFTHSAPKLAAQNIQFRVPNPTASMSADGTITITKPYSSAKIHYTTDGSSPTKKSKLYESPFKANRDTKLKMATFLCGRTSRVVEGFTQPPIATWSPETTPAVFAVIGHDITNAIKAPGTYTFTLDYSKGANSLDIQQVSISSNGKTLSSDKHTGSTGYKDEKNTYVISLGKDQYSPDATYTLHTKVKGDGGTDSSGNITMSYEPIRAARTITTSLATHSLYYPEKASDHRDNTWFHGASSPKKDDHVTVTWKQAQTGKTAYVVTGKPDGRDQLVSGVLEISYDGKTWEKGNDIVFGKAEFAIPTGKAILALRIRATATQPTWLAVRELNIK